MEWLSRHLQTNNTHLTRWCTHIHGRREIIYSRLVKCQFIVMKKFAVRRILSYGKKRYTIPKYISFVKDKNNFFQFVVFIFNRTSTCYFFLIMSKKSLEYINIGYASSTPVDFNHVKLKSKNVSLLFKLIRQLISNLNSIFDVHYWCN